MREWMQWPRPKAARAAYRRPARRQRPRMRTRRVPSPPCPPTAWNARGKGRDRRRHPGRGFTPWRGGPDPARVAHDRSYSHCAPAADPPTILPMQALALHRFTAWLCLALALATGVTPAQGFVLCVEPDGCVSVELTATVDHCATCDEHAASGAGAMEVIPLAADTNCPCIDFALPGSTHEPAVQPKAADAEGPTCCALRPTCTALPFLMPAPTRHARRGEVPRPPDSLRLLRSVVLLL